MTEAYLDARRAVNYMRDEMESIWNSTDREQSWNDNEAFVKWLGSSEKMGSAKRKIYRIHKKFQKKFVLEVTRKNKGRCTGWISAWTIPYGRVRIRLCEDFFIYRTHLQEKILIHEVGHEAGMFSHHRIHNCRSARRAAFARTRSKAKQSPENFAWLAMHFINLTCLY